MADEADRTQERLELEAELLKQHHKKSLVPIEGTGYCLNCGEEIDTSMRWCDSHCRDDYEHRNK